MKTKTNDIALPNTVKRLSIWAVVVAALLTIPVVGQWPWTASDFVIAAVLLFGSATAYELITRSMIDKNHRIIAAVIIVLALGLVWAELAVGLFGTPFAGS